MRPFYYCNCSTLYTVDSLHKHVFGTRVSLPCSFWTSYKSMSVLITELACSENSAVGPTNVLLVSWVCLQRVDWGICSRVRNICVRLRLWPSYQGSSSCYAWQGRFWEGLSLCAWMNAQPVSTPSLLEFYSKSFSTSSEAALWFRSAFNATSSLLSH